MNITSALYSLVSQMNIRIMLHLRRNLCLLYLYWYKMFNTQFLGYYAMKTCMQDNIYYVNV